CYKARCVQNLNEPKNALDEMEEFGGMKYISTRMFYNGRVSIPEDFILDYENLQVLYGPDNKVQNVDEVNGTFWVRLNAKGTTLLILRTNYEETEMNTPVMMTVFPTNGKGYFKRENIEFSVRETATALVFLQPGIATTSNPVYNAVLLERIRSLKATKILTRMLRDKMRQMSPNIIVSGDVEVQNVIAAAVNELYENRKEESSSGLEFRTGEYTDDETENFWNVESKENYETPYSGEVDRVFLGYFNQNGPHIKAKNNTKPRWVYYYVDAMPTTAVLPSEESDDGVDDYAEPALIVPPKKYVSPRLYDIVRNYVRDNSEDLEETLLAEDQENDISARISFESDISTDKAPLMHKGEFIDEGFVVGYVPAPDIADSDKHSRALGPLWATYFSQIILPVIQISGGISTRFSEKLTDFFQEENKAMDEHPVYMVSKHIVREGIGLRVNDFMKTRKGYYTKSFYKHDLFTHIMDVLNSSFEGKTNTSQSLLEDIEKMTGSSNYVTQLKKSSELIFGKIIPVDAVLRFRGMGQPVEEFVNEIFNRGESGVDYYYFNEKNESDDDDDDQNGETKEPFPTEEDVCAQEKCLCKSEPGFSGGSYVVKDVPGCMIHIPAAGVTFPMGTDDSDAFDMERPEHQANLKEDYLIDKYEVTVAQYKKFLNDTENKLWRPEYASIPDNEHGNKKCLGNQKYLEEWFDPLSTKMYLEDRVREDFPITAVCWYAARAYCEWAGKRLPYETEWEYAVRSDDGRNLPWEQSFWNASYFTRRANFRNSGDPMEPSKIERDSIPEDILVFLYPEPHVTPVGIYNGSEYMDYQTHDGSSPFGLMDTAGNAEEWVYTRFFYYADLEAGGAPTPVGDQRTVRGGSWSSSRMLVRATFRRGVNPEFSSNAIGFRCAADAE
ncbi:MAG: SUMF1/EgtB/PvdO family nonheme iron enzyme, partial [bacterium]